MKSNVIVGMKRFRIATEKVLPNRFTKQINSNTMGRYKISTSLIKNLTLKMLIISGVFLLKACGAPDVQHYFKIDNNANHAISFYVAESYPDTLIVLAKPVLKAVPSNSSYKESDWGTWDERFSQIEGGMISVFIFHSDTLNKYSWEEIRDGYMILKRYDLSLEDLKQSNFTLIYP